MIRPLRISVVFCLPSHLLYIFSSSLVEYELQKYSVVCVHFFVNDAKSMHEIHNCNRRSPKEYGGDSFSNEKRNLFHKFYTLFLKSTYIRLLCPIKDDIFKEILVYF